MRMPGQILSAAVARRESAVRDPVLTFLRQIWSVDHALQKMSKRMATSLGITGPQRLALRMIGQHPGLSAGELAGLLHLDPSTVTGILDRLERSRMVTRLADPADGRRARLYLARAGKLQYRKQSGTVEAAVRRALETVAPGQVKSAARVFAALAAELTLEIARPEQAGRARVQRTLRTPRPGEADRALAG